MFLRRLRDTLQFFWLHLTELLWRLAPVALPFLLFGNYRFVMIHAGDTEKAMSDPLTLLPQMLAGVAATALTIVYTLRKLQVGKDPSPGLATLWREAAWGFPSLLAVQLLAGAAILGGLLLLILPGIYLMGALLPAYVIAVHERQAPVAALKASWARYRGQAWALGADVLLLVPCLLIIFSGLGALEQLLNDTPDIIRVVAMSALDLVAMLFAQLPGILLARFYVMEDISAN
ncbi:MAG: hypothetical protein PSX71_03355 [bacterium]|nr:hypothetical protein [bacterium]